MDETHLGTPVPDTTLAAHNPVTRPSSRFDAWWLLLIGVIALIALLAFIRPDPFQRIVVFVQDGILITLQVTLTSFVLVLVVGLIGGLGRISTNWFLHGLATLYVEVVRGIPLLVQILSWFFAFPAIVRNIGNQFNIPAFKDYLANPVFMVIVALTFCYGAYMSEVYRAGIQSISKGQMEAARSLGMTYIQAMRYVILPQAIRVILPPIGNEFISLLKDSSLVSVVAVADITLRGRQFMATSYLAIETWMMVALIYLVLTLFSTRVVNWIELKTRLER